MKQAANLRDGDHWPRARTQSGKRDHRGRHHSPAAYRAYRRSRDAGVGCDYARPNLLGPGVDLHLRNLRFDGIHFDRRAAHLLFGLSQSEHSGLNINARNIVEKTQMRNPKAIVLAISILALLLCASGFHSFAFAADQQAAPAASDNSSAAAPSPGAPQPGMMMPGGRMMGRGSMMGGKGMMGGGMGMGQGMMDGCPMMMDVDPKTRGEMMQIQGRMMKEMGELMERRGKEIEQGK
jgi:hypothetical protein